MTVGPSSLADADVHVDVIDGVLGIARKPHDRTRYRAAVFRQLELLNDRERSDNILEV